MKSTTSFTVEPFLLKGSKGSIACFYYPPKAGVPPKGDIVLAPAFAEEMNRCRAMVSMQARALSTYGVGTLVSDMLGTGDSAGEFSDASWEIWHSDLKLGIAWLREHAHGCNTIWGIRLGAIMAAQLAAEDSLIERIMFWQPIIQGKNYWTQFLRIRIAAEMEMKDGVKSTEALRKCSEQGGIVEVSGYPVGSALARRLDDLRMPEIHRLADKEVTWFEMLSGPDSALPRASAKYAEEIRASGTRVELKAITGPPFWQVHERELALNLIVATTQAIQQWTPLSPHSPKSVPDFGSLTHTTGAEHPVVFSCGEAELSGVIHHGSPSERRGVIIVVAGGPQFRVGAHRQFVSLARRLSSQGFPVLRFDLRGMGDSSGEYSGYQQSRPDIRAAIDKFVEAESQVNQVCLFGECESASGILFYAYQDPRVTRIALVNPWVRTQEGQAEVILKHYYLDRLLSRQFWKAVREGRFNPFQSLLSFFDVLRAYHRGRKTIKNAGPASKLDDFDQLPLPVKTAEGLRRFRGPVLILMSGRDYIAREFDEVTKSSKAWEGLLSDAHVTRKDIADADHTFSKATWKTEAQDTLLRWMGEP